MPYVQRIFYSGEPTIDIGKGAIILWSVTNITETFVFDTNDGPVPNPSLPTLFIDVMLASGSSMFSVYDRYVNTSTLALTDLPIPTVDYSCPLLTVYYNAVTGVITNLTTDPYIILTNRGMPRRTGPGILLGYTTDRIQFYEVNVSTRELIRLPTQRVYYNRITGDIVATHIPILPAINDSWVAPDYPYIEVPNLSPTLADIYKVDVGRNHPDLILKVLVPPEVPVMSIVPIALDDIVTVLNKVKDAIHIFDASVVITSSDIANAFSEVSGSLLIAEAVVGVTSELAAILNTLTITNSLISAQNQILADLTSTHHDLTSTHHDLRDDVRALKVRGVDPEKGICMYMNEITSEHAMNRAITINALRKSNNLQPVSDEMVTPTHMPLGTSHYDLKIGTT